MKKTLGLLVLIITCLFFSACEKDPFIEKFHFTGWQIIDAKSNTEKIDLVIMKAGQAAREEAIVEKLEIPSAHEDFKKVTNMKPGDKLITGVMRLHYHDVYWDDQNPVSKLRFYTEKDLENK